MALSLRLSSTGILPSPCHLKWLVHRSLISGKYRVLGGKTGYTDAAGYCLVIAVEIDGRELAMVFLGSQGKLTRYGDFNRVVGWVLDGMPNKDKAIQRE